MDKENKKKKESDLVGISFPTETTVNDRLGPEGVSPYFIVQTRQIDIHAFAFLVLRGPTIEAVRSVAILLFSSRTENTGKPFEGYEIEKFWKMATRSPAAEFVLPKVPWYVLRSTNPRRNRQEKNRIPASSVSKQSNLCCTNRNIFTVTLFRNLCKLGWLPIFGTGWNEMLRPQNHFLMLYDLARDGRDVAVQNN